MCIQKPFLLYGVCVELSGSFRSSFHLPSAFDAKIGTYESIVSGMRLYTGAVELVVLVLCLSEDLLLFQHLIAYCGTDSSADKFL